MKKITLFIFSILIGSAFGQVDGIVIKVEGGTTDYSGGTYNVTAPSDQTYEFNFNVYNNTGSDQDWYITRNKISVSPGWVDGCCWGHSTDPFGGTCFSTGSMDMASWTMGSSAVFTLSDGEYGKLKPQVNPADGVSGSAHYRYLIGKEVNGSIVQVDSVDLIIDYTLGISTVTPSVVVSIIPNPASEELLISLDGVNKAEATVFDVLGNKITSTLVEKSKKINVQNYKNGVYFINLLTSNNQEITKKVIIRH